jgi:hypothetical protein
MFLQPVEMKIERHFKVSQSALLSSFAYKVIPGQIKHHAMMIYGGVEV